MKIDRIFFLVVTVIASLAVALMTTTARAAGDFSRTWLWNPAPNKMVETTKYKKSPPYTIGLSNASVSNSWAFSFVQEVEAEAAKHKSIGKLFITDGQDKPDKQIADTEDLIARGVDLLIVRAATAAALSPIVERAMKAGIPVICAGRRVTTDNFVSFVQSSNITQGRIKMLWIAQMLKGKGNIVLLSGVAGSGPVQDRLAGAREVLAQFPDIKVLDHQYTNFSVAEGKKVMAALIQAHGRRIDAVWSDSSLQASGAIEAWLDAKMPVPPITGDDLNAYLKRIDKNKLRAMSIGFPVKMGAEAVRTALSVLQGIPVPFDVDVPRTIVTTVDTKDVKSDIPFSKFVRHDQPDDWWVDR